MKKQFIVGLIILIGALSSCSKQETAIPVVSFDRYMLGKSDADTIIENVQESPVFTEENFGKLIQVCSVWSESDLRAVLTPGMNLDTSYVARHERFKYLMSKLGNRSGSPSSILDGSRVETIIQLTPTRRIIDANPEVLAMTIASLGSSVAGSGTVSYDFHKSSQNKITTTDIFLANWAVNTVNQSGSQIISNDGFIEFQDQEPTYLLEASGGNYFVEAALVYNGPTTQFTYFDVNAGLPQTVTIETGEVMLYGSDSPYGELFMNLTLQNETFGSANYVDAVVSGPIPGGTFITLTGGPWPTIN